MKQPKKKVQKHIEKKDGIISGAEEKLLKDTEALQSDIEKTVSEELYNFENKNGKLVRSKKNYDKINSLSNTMKKQVNEGGYVTDYLKSFDEIEAINTDIHKDLNDVDIDVSKVNRYKQELIETTIENLQGSGLDANFIQPAREILFKNVTLGTPISELSKQMKEYLVGDKEKQGKLARYSTQITRDAVSQYDGAINAMVQQEFGMDAIMYVGSIITDSRPQCRRWASMDFIPVDKLKEEIAWARNNGSGFIPTTNIYNFCSNRGGYSCRHQAIATFSEVLKD